MEQLVDFYGSDSLERHETNPTGSFCPAYSRGLASVGGGGASRHPPVPGPLPQNQPSPLAGGGTQSKATLLYATCVTSLCLTFMQILTCLWNRNFVGMKANLSLPYKHAGPARRKQRGVVSKPLLSTLPDYSTEGRGYENSLSHRHFLRFLEKDGPGRGATLILPSRESTAASYLTCADN